MTGLKNTKIKKCEKYWTVPQRDGIVYTSRSNQPEVFTEVKKSSDVLGLINNLKTQGDVE